jgi:hypothetical protein
MTRRTIFFLIGVVVGAASWPVAKANFCPAEHYHWVQLGIDLGNRCLWTESTWRFWCTEQDRFAACKRDREMVRGVLG